MLWIEEPIKVNTALQFLKATTMLLTDNTSKDVEIELLDAAVGRNDVVKSSVPGFTFGSRAPRSRPSWGDAILIVIVFAAGVVGVVPALLSCVSARSTGRTHQPPRRWHDRPLIIYIHMYTLYPERNGDTAVAGSVHPNAPRIATIPHTQ